MRRAVSFPSCGTNAAAAAVFSLTPSSASLLRSPLHGCECRQKSHLSTSAVYLPNARGIGSCVSSVSAVSHSGRAGWPNIDVTMRRSIGQVIMRGAAAVAPAAAGAGAAAAAPLRTPARHQGTLQQLINDPTDPYCALVQELDLPAILQTMSAGPSEEAASPAAVVAAAHRPLPPPGPRRSPATAATSGDGASSSGNSSTDGASAVLQSMYAEGVARRAAVMAAEEAAAAAALAAMSEEEKAKLREERVVRHLFDGLCAASAVLKTYLIEPEEGTPAAVAAALGVFRLVNESRPRVAPEAWEADFSPEMRELAELLAVGGCRDADVAALLPTATESSPQQ